MKRLLVVAIGCVAGLNPAFGQNVQGASRWANALSWKATFIGSGNGEGPWAGGQAGGCTFSYDNVQSADVTAVLTGPPGASAYPYGPIWTGTTNPGLSLTVTTSGVCPSVPSSCTTTNSAHDASAPLSLVIDTTGNGAYSVFLGLLADTVQSCLVPPTASSAPWGPVFNPDGSAVGASGLGGQIPLPAKGVHLQDTIPTYTDSQSELPATWNISWDFSPVCKIDTAQLIPQRQNNPDWDDDNYDHSGNAETIGTKGCAITSLSMALYFAGLTTIVTPDGPEPNDPGSLNFYMEHQDTDYNGLSVAWDKTVRNVSGGLLKFNAFNNKQGGWKSTASDPQGAKQDLDDALCGANPHPVIVGVTGSDGSFPGHFVLVTGRDANDTYSIIDPIGKGTTLDDYGDKFETRGTVVPVVDPPGVSIGALDISVGNHASLLVTDFAGNRTGFIPESGQVVQNIPNSAYFIDALTNDITSAAPTETAHSAEIFQPATGSYTIVATGFSKGLYQVSIGAFSQDGSAQAPVVVQGTAQPGSTLTYTLAFNPAIGSTPVVTAMPGDRNGDGKVDCADLAIVKAAFGKSIGQPGYDPRADVNGDGVINIIDLATVAQALPAGSACQ